MAKVELKMVTDIYKEDKAGKLKLVKRNVLTKNFIDLKEITFIGECIDDNGKVEKDCCKANIINLGQVVFHHSYEFIKSLKENEDKDEKKKPIGFTLPEIPKKGKGRKKPAAPKL